MNRMLKSAVIVLLCCMTGTPIAQAQPRKPGAIRINHVALYVSNLAKSTSFYREIIGLDTIPEPFHDGKHTWFSIGDKAHLHLIEGRKQPSESEKNTHLCFSTAKLDHLLEKLNRQHIPYEDWAGHPSGVTRRVDGVRQVYFRDPDGYWIEINDDFQ